MPPFLQRFFGARTSVPESKASRIAPLLAFDFGGRPKPQPRDLVSMIREAFLGNVVANRCVRLIATAAADVPLLTYIGPGDDETHPLARLIAAPNAIEARTGFLERVYGHIALSGNAFIERIEVEGAVRELHVLRPDRMRVVPGADGWPTAWDYTAAGRTTRIPARDAAGETPTVLHIAGFHPLDDHYGFAPVEAALQAVALYEAAGRWSQGLLENAARPSGALIYTGPEGATLSDDQVERLRADFAESYAGASNAGRPLLLDGGLDWKPLALSPRELDFIETRAAAARDIAVAFGVPPMLVGLTGDATYANYQEANRAFYRLTVLPLVNRVADELTRWLSPHFPGAPTLKPDEDAIPALRLERAEWWRVVADATFLTDPEKRDIVGFGEDGHRKRWR